MTIENTEQALTEDIEVIGPGQILAEAREAQGLTQQQVADKLNFRASLVEDIENDIFDRKLPVTFNRGYLKNYAKLVKISADDVLAGFEMLGIAEEHGAEIQAAEMQSFSKQTEKQAENNLLMWISYLILALLIGSTILWWLQDTQQVKPITSFVKKLSTETIEDNQPVAQPAKETLPPEPLENDLVLAQTKTATLSETLKNKPETTGAEFAVDVENKELNSQEVDDNNTQEQVVVEVEAEPQSSGNESVINNENSAPLSTEVDNASTDADVILAEPAIDFGEIESVEFTFSGDCWVNIYDATGERIAWGIKKSGYVMNITGQAPFTITLGKPELVSINFEQQSIDMSQFNRGNIAKFTLPLE